MYVYYYHQASSLPLVCFFESCTALARCRYDTALQREAAALADDDYHRHKMMYMLHVYITMGLLSTATSCTNTHSCIYSMLRSDCSISSDYVADLQNNCTYFPTPSLHNTMYMQNNGGDYVLCLSCPNKCDNYYMCTSICDYDCDYFVWICYMAVWQDVNSEAWKPKHNCHIYGLLASFLPEPILTACPFIAFLHAPMLYMHQRVCCPFESSCWKVRKADGHQ